jgi:ech hydrogenase subunit A
LKGVDAVEKLMLAVAILLPMFSALLCFVIRKAAVRNFIVVISTLVMFVVAGEFVHLLSGAGGKILINFNEIPLGGIIAILDIILLIYVGYIGINLRKPIIVILAIVQFIPVVILEMFIIPKEPDFSFVIDYLSLVMILLISIIGPIITVFAIGYMKEHEHHIGLKRSKQPRFFFIIFMFLGAMNALVMTNNLSWMYFFWEVTTLCSFLLISHDGNTESVKNAVRALWINSLGGVAFISAILMIYQAKGTLAIDQIIKMNASGLTGLLPIGLGLLCFAGFTKSAQFPFQSWLLGAMVAPTPVSALLHSSTMVKAGVYLIVRLAPAYAGTTLGKVVAVVGGFTFLAGSAIAISQRNGKRVLAYSTIANLGLIICCAGIGTNIAIAAAVLLIIFHAVSKGLLFLCVGTIEQGIGSRDIEDMQGLMKKMPFTTVVTVIGMISMLLPPFGVLITKWLAIESSVDARSPIVLICIILGSAFTVVFWAKWIGIILTMSYKIKYKVEKLSFTIKSALVLLVAGVVACSVLLVPLYNNLIKPYITGINSADKSLLAGKNLGISLQGINSTVIGGFASIVFFIVVFAVMITIPYFLHKTKAETIKPPYLCGENTSDRRGIEFMSPADKVDSVVVHNYYLTGFFGENNLTLWVNLAAVAIILIMFGVVI